MAACAFHRKNRGGSEPGSEHSRRSAAGFSFSLDQRQGLLVLGHVTLMTMSPLERVLHDVATDLNQRVAVEQSLASAGADVAVPLTGERSAVDVVRQGIRRHQGTEIPQALADHVADEP